MTMRLRLIALSTLVALGAVAGYFAWAIPSISKERKADAHSVLRFLTKPMDERFRLIDHLGRPVGPDTFPGKVRLVFFGFTHCPDVCRTGLSLMSQLLDELGHETKDVQALFISVDPKRDTVDVLKQYMSAFSGNMLGLTGTPDQIANVTSAFSAYFKKVPQPSGGYTVDHTASVYVLYREGSFRSTVDIHERQDVALQKIRRVLSPS